MSVTSHPPLVIYKMEDEYRAHFERVYCQRPIITFDGIPVRFRKERFDHCMYESSKRNDEKDHFSPKRAQRMDWIEATLTNPVADLYQGWDKRKKCFDPNGRVAVVFEEFVVVILVKKNRDGKFTADFITAYFADNSIGKIRSSPKWDKRKCR